MTAFGAIYRLVLRRLLTGARAIGFGAIAVLMVFVGIVLHRHDASSYVPTVRVVASFGLLLVVPLVCLVVATPAIGEWIEDETLVYVWLRPVSRTTLAVAPWLAAITVAVPMNVVSIGLLAGFGSGFESAPIRGAVLASAVASIAYCSFFVLLGASSKRGLVSGFAYVFVWEGLLAQYGPGFARLSIRSYAVSILSSATDVGLRLDGRSSGAVVVMLLIVVGGGLGLTTLILQRKDVP